MFELPDLAYAYDALEPYIDEQTMHLHHDKHHAGYVSKLNDALKNHNQYLRLEIDELMKKLNSLPDSIKTPVRNHGGGHANHSLFWKVMSPKRKSEPEGKLEQMLRASFGDFQKFKEIFARAALGRFGSGWAWLVVNKGKLEVIDTPNQDTPLSNGQVPILGLDIWEHAYYLKYQNRRNDYIEAWWNVVNWGEVEINLSKAV